MNNLRQLMLCDLLYANDWDQYLAGVFAIIAGPNKSINGNPMGVVTTYSPTNPVSWDGNDHRGLLALGGHLTDANFWKCPSAQAREPRIHGYAGTALCQYDYTVLVPTWGRRYTGSPPDANGLLDTNWFQWYQAGLRKISTFPSASQTVVFAEENTTLANDCGCGHTIFDVINDPQFCDHDVVEPRYLNNSTAGCFLDGHVILIPCAIPDGCTSGQAFRYGEAFGPKQIYCMPEILSIPYKLYLGLYICYNSNRFITKGEVENV